jgi:hypothetical protein
MPAPKLVILQRDRGSACQPGAWVKGASPLEILAFSIAQLPIDYGSMPAS